MKIRICLIVIFFSFTLWYGCKNMQPDKVAEDLPCSAAEELITTAHYPNGEAVPYILNYNNLPPKFVIILFPGGSGRVNPHMEDGKIVYGFKGNFLIRSRKYIVDDEFATITTNSTSSEERVQAILDDVKRRFPGALVYLMGTSNGTDSTMRLAGYLSDKIAGEIHTSSRSAISFFDARKYKNRHLVVHHKYDPCRATPFSSAEYSHKKYGNEFIAMEGGISTGDSCEAFSYHGYNGIENETISAIKKWIKQSG